MAQVTGNSADYYESRREAGLYGAEKSEKLYGNLAAVHETHCEKTMKEHHAENAEATDFVKSVNTFLFFHWLTLYK